MKPLLQIREEKERNFQLAAYGVIAIALVSACAKAEIASLTTDEAWAYNMWISEGLQKIWQDYHLPTNHILYSISVYLCLSLFGLDEFVLRLPSLLSFAGFLLILKYMIQISIRHISLRFLCLVSVALHPYVIDFAALSRGYTLMNACLYGALCLALTYGQRRSEWKLLVAGIALGCAFGAIPISLYLILALNIVMCSSFCLSKSSNLRKELLMFLLPQLVVVTLVFFFGFEGLDSKGFFWGHKTFSESLNSLGQILLYIPQGQLDFMGYPNFSFPSLNAWQQDFFSRNLSAWFYQMPLGFFLLSLFALAAVLVGRNILKKYPDVVWNDSLLFFASIWLVSVAGAFVHGWAFGALYLRNRVWLPWIPLCFLMSFRCVDFLLCQTKDRLRQKVHICVICVCLVFNAYWLSKIDLQTYWEWPNDSVVKMLFQKLKEAPIPKSKASLGLPFYHHATFVFYRDYYGLDWLEFPVKQSHLPLYDLMFVSHCNMRIDLSDYREILSYPQCDIKLYKHKDLNTIDTDKIRGVIHD